MKRRLPPQPGEWIDRARPIEFRFEGSTYQGFAGDVLTSALWANGVRLLGRSFKYHRPRGLYSLANLDVNLMVEDGRRTNLRGDVLPIEAGLDVRAVNTVGGLARDRLRITERFGSMMPVGFYYKAFHTPRRLFPIYENMMRKVAGLGRIRADNKVEPTPKDYAFCDLLVVGAGPAGLSAAIAAAEQGLQVMLVDEQARPGGSLCWQYGTSSGGTSSSGTAALEDLLARARNLPNIELRLATQAAGWYADHWVALVDERRLTKLRAGALLVASGCHEQPAVFQNNDLPGVMLGSAAQRLVRLYAVKPMDRCVVLAANSDGYRVALDLHAAGVAVAAIVDLRAEGESSDLASQVARASIPVYREHTISEAVAGAAHEGVVAAMICPLDANGHARTDAAQRIDCDGIAVSVGWSPAAALAYQAGGRFKYDDRVHQLVPKTLPASVFTAGRMNGVYELTSQLADGRRAGLAAAQYLNRYDGPLPEPPAHAEPAPSHPYPIFAHPKKKNFVDFDEDLHLVDFVNAHQEGYDNIELVKRYTTVGMGPSQGKLANMNAVRILARLNGKSINETGTTTSRPFHQPVSLAHLAGRRFHPLRYTSLHAWHADAGAKFVHAGVWLRPEVYERAGATHDNLVLEEATHVRRQVGLIDVGTLGKFEVRGPDAVEFLERVYTDRFANQKLGRLRYGLCCDETGVILDDGIIGRLGDDRFYVTATTSGAAVLFREMQRFAQIWNLNVALINLTGQLAAMNLAGPLARDVLAGLTDVDLSAAVFPFSGVREGTVAGVPALLMRVGFVGELGYEIHVPASYGWHVWTRLVEAGKPHGIRPFGTDAQRLLRLEKGHLIVSLDTDALTHPYEVGLEWVVAEDKPFFVGQRSLAIVKRQPLTRKLVGFVFPRGYSGPLPEDCHLIRDGDTTIGRVTSIAHRSTLGQAIGLAFVHPDHATPGTRLNIYVAGGRVARAEVVSLPFYDPEHLRQK